MDIFKNDDPKALIQILEIVLPVISKLPSGLVVGVEQLVPPKVWRTLTNVQKRLVGQRISLLVSMGELPLYRDIDSSAGHKRYRVK